MPLTASFHDVRFPAPVAFGATGGPMRRTEVVALGSGFEQRNSRFADSRRRYDAASGVRTLDQLQAVISFFEQRRGRLYGFRYRDPVDCSSCLPSGVPAASDQIIGTGTGTLAQFQLVKRYGTGTTAYVRPITRPVAGTVLVAVNGVSAAPATWSVDTTTGIVTFATGSRPANGATVTAGFWFDVPVRFDTDEIRVDLSHFAAGEIPPIPMIEIRA
jgi:uncharacterized protein (TIGR02217 family)